MIKRLSSSLSKIKEFLYSVTAARAIVYGIVAAALLWMWLTGDGESVAFVYNEF